MLILCMGEARWGWCSRSSVVGAFGDKEYAQEGYRESLHCTHHGCYQPVLENDFTLVPAGGCWDTQEVAPRSPPQVLRPSVLYAVLQEGSVSSCGCLPRCRVPRAHYARCASIKGVPGLCAGKLQKGPLSFQWVRDLFTQGP